MMKKRKIKLFFLLLFFFISANLFSKIEELNLKAENGYYKKINNQKVFIAQGNAHVTIDENDVYCDEMEIYLTEDDNVDKALFKKNIIIFQDKDKIHIGGEYAEYYKKDKQFVIRENAFYIDVDNEVAVFGDSINNHDKEKVAIIQGNVRIFQKDIYAKGAFVKYTKNDKQMEISGFPSIENQGSEYSAKKIIIDVDNNTFLLEGGLEATILNESPDEKKDESDDKNKKTIDKTQKPNPNNQKERPTNENKEKR
jgi:lipopolysaccharide export system protein LptA